MSARTSIFLCNKLISRTNTLNHDHRASVEPALFLNMLLAVLEKRAGFKLGVKDVFLNMAGGLKVSDPACDLAVISAVLSSNFDFAIPADVCFAGEVGLSGEIRPVAQTDRRIIEAARLGFKRIFVSSFSSLEGLADQGVNGIEVVKVADVPSLCRSLFKGN